MAKPVISQLFSKEKIVSNPTLNRLGAQPIRIIAARTLRNCRLYRPRLNDNFAQQINTLNREGMLVIPNFLPDELFEKIRTEALSLTADTAKASRQITFGPNTTFAYDLDEKEFPIGNFPAMEQFYNNKKLLALFEGGLHKKVQQKNIVKWLEWLRQGEGKREDDNQTEMHSDTYYDTYKAWLYLEDITVEKAPFAFVKGSHRVELSRLRHDYQNSIQTVPSPSRRITPVEIAERGLRETVVVCKANSLCIANTFGYHRRLEGVANHSRLALYASVRFHPFAF